MNPENQNQQNTNPDLDFIRNTTDPLETPVKKGLDKKIIVIIVLVVITLGVLVFGMVTGANKKVQKSDNSSNKPQKNSVNIASQKDIAYKYIDAMSVNDLAEAKKYLSSSKENNQRDLSFEYTDLWQKIDPKQCQALDSDSTATKVRINCIYIKDKLLAFSFVIKTDESGPKIEKYTVWIIKGATNVQ